MTGSFRTRLLVWAALAAVSPAGLAAQRAPAWTACKTDSLSTYNCASYYSGTVTMNSTLKATGVNQFTVVTATVTAGKVSCRLKTEETPEFTAPGMLMVEHDNNQNSGGYEIKVWCPDEPGKRVTRDDYALIEVMKQESRDYTRLDGQESYEHPDADDVNGVTGTVTTSWHLERK